MDRRQTANPERVVDMDRENFETVSLNLSRKVIRRIEPAERALDRHLPNTGGTYQRNLSVGDHLAGRWAEAIVVT